MNLSQPVLGILLGIPNVTTISDTINSVSKALEKHFILYEAPEDTLFPIFDGTYLYIDKPSDFELQKKTWSVQKNRNLVKPMMIVLEDGKKGFKVHMPALKANSNNQFTIQQGNISRKCTLVRWLVEANLTMAMINCFCPPLMEDTERHQQIALDALARSQMDNRMKKRVARDKLDRRTENWTTASAGDVQGFPILSLQDLEKLTLGVYQVSLAKEYTKKHLKFEANLQDHNAITGYYCDCWQGARTVGMCAHVTCVIWFIGYKCHQPESLRNRQPRVLDFLDAAVVLRGQPGTSATALAEIEPQDSQEFSDDDSSPPSVRILRSHRQ
ncbi:hypothetical protein Fcan01_17179 [Folsomia candida]|uniref:SWIM-type domain-containing protein n=1 Tax=Folsomia candida TaxID=158441 RepID=A0A226DQG5_FOLCA|nr:hypothetical protein Fcan01_17179 [Folsomia candida]